MVKENKTVIVKELVDNYKNNQAVYFIDYKGLTVEQISELRTKLRGASALMKVYKNTLALRAAKEVYEDLSSDIDTTLSGPTAIIFSEDDPVGPAKTIVDFVKDNEIVSIKGGILAGKYIDQKSIKGLSSLPSREVLIAKLLMLLNSPITGFVNVLQGNTRSFVQVLNAIKDKKEQA